MLEPIEEKDLNLENKFVGKSEDGANLGKNLLN